MVEMTMGARRLRSATAARIRSAPGTYSAPEGYIKSICVSMSKKTVFTLYLLVKSQQFRAMVHTILLVGIEQTANGRGQTLDGFGCVLPGSGYFGKGLNQLARHQHRAQQG